MHFVPSDAYIIMGHGKDPEVTLKEEKDFVPCPCKIKAKQKDVTIGTKTNNGLMDVDSFFIVPDNCIIVVKMTPGAMAYGHIILPLLNKIGAAESQEIYRNPISNTKELIKELGTVSIYKPGDKCPNFEYSLFFSRDNLILNTPLSHLGLLKTPLKNTLGEREMKSEDKIIDTINEIYGESEFPKKEGVNAVILHNMSESADPNSTLKDMITADRSNCGLLLDYAIKYFSVTQKQLLRIDNNGIAKRPGVYYNFICRELPEEQVDYYKYDDHELNELENMKNKVDPNITSILQEPILSQRLFKRILSETVSKRKPYVRNLYTGGKRKRTRKNKLSRH
jgi:hypothetical protein